MLLLLGCTGDFNSSIKGLTDEMITSNLTLNSSDDIMNYTNGTCISMICTNKTPPFPFNLFFDASLKGGNCTFDVCNESRYISINYEYNEKGNATRFFMFGAGHSFLSFSDANLYCNNTMKMSVKWLIGNNLTPYPVPTKERAECFLDKNIIPVYILYSNFTNINIARAGEIASNLSGAGPAIIVSEAELDDSNVSRYLKIYGQISEMRTNCPTCLIALGIKLNGSTEYNTTNSIFTSYPNILNNIDLVAYGLNSHYFKECNPDKMIWYAINYSKYILHTYSKPSLITYVLFDVGNSSDNSCKWLNETAGNGYSKLYTYSSSLVSNGVIGASIYSFYGIGPFQCENCAFVDPNYGPNQCNPNFRPEKMNPRFFNYFGFCQAYYLGIDADPNSQPPPQPGEQRDNKSMNSMLPLVFSNGSQNCNFAYNSNILRYMNISDTEIKPLITYNITASEPFFSCAGCFGGNIPTNFIDLPTAHEDLECTKYKPQIEIAADNFDMDPTLLRAVVWQESNFDKCAVSYAPNSSKRCNPYYLMEVPDPNHCCTPQWYPPHYEDLCDSNPLTTCKLESSIAPYCKGNPCKPCAYGLAQVVEYPWDVYYAHPNDPIPHAVRACATKLTQSGYPDFNPYRPYDSPCAYAYKFMDWALPTGRGTVTAHIADLDAYDEIKKEWFAVFFALDNMYGHQSKPACHAASESQLDWIDHFNNQKNRTDCDTNPIVCTGDGSYPQTRRECCGNKDFLNYVKYCEHGGTFSYAYDVLARYTALTKDCSAPYCPDSGGQQTISDKNIMEYLCEHGYVGGAPGVPDCCQYARIPMVGYSSWWFCRLNNQTPKQCKREYCPYEADK